MEKHFEERIPDEYFLDKCSSMLLITAVTAA